MENIKKYVAELIGTCVLVFMGCGSAVFLGANADASGNIGQPLAVALAFGLAIVAMAYVIGGISGCHVNPAVSLAMLLNKKLSAVNFIGYVVAQIIGAIAGAGLLKWVSSMNGIDHTGALGSNGLNGLGIAGAGIVEIVLTFIFVFVILGVTSDDRFAGVSGLIIGLTLTFVHIVGIPLTGTSVNPARSIGPALFAGGSSLANVWVFILFPLVGAALAWAVFKLLRLKDAK